VSAITVRGLAITPIKGTRLRPVDGVVLDREGVRENRRFYLIDGRDRMVNGKHLGELNALVASYADSERRLTVTFPDGRVLEGEIRHGGAVTARFYSTTAAGELVEGPWSGALSAYAGQPLRLVEAADVGAVDRGAGGAVSLISSASLSRLAEVAGRDDVDPRRFRMLIEIDGVDPHAEDRWVGRSVRIGEATVRFEGHVGRCLVTSRDPDTGRIDLPTLDVLDRYRGAQDTTEPLAFGIYGAVAEPGAIRVGDRVLGVDSLREE
jgi:uncharacterized protein YcbX